MVTVPGSMQPAVLPLACYHGGKTGQGSVKWFSESGISVTGRPMPIYSLEAMRSC